MKISEIRELFKTVDTKKSDLKDNILDKAIKLIEDGENIFITGGGGVGKSYLLKRLCEVFNITVTSTTGISALNVGGQTIHSWSGIGLANKSFAETLEKIQSNKYKKTQIHSTEILAIDEISMLDDYTFDFINSIIKEVNGNSKPFGGIQIILVGDFFQLPPVELGKNKDFCFKSKTWKELNLTTLNLTKVWRQDDLKLVKSLNDIREGINNNTEIFESRNFVTPPKDCVRLYSTNQEVNSYNKACFDAIPEKIYTYNSSNELFTRIGGVKKSVDPRISNLPEWDRLIYDNFNSNCKAPEKLELKKTCRVMLLQNINVEKGLVNGSCGEVIDLSPYMIKVKFDNGIIKEIERSDFEYYQNNKLKVRRNQFPLMLAYACSIHKSQGMTFDKVFVDFKRIFTFGQAYVALSRVRSLNGLFLSNFSPFKIQANPEVIQFYQDLK